jgi:addiction module HigA family antidote
MVRIPTHRAPTHPGDILKTRFLQPLHLTQVAAAERLGIPLQRLNEIVRRRRGVTPDTALRLARLFGNSPGFWLNLQLAWDLYHAQHAPGAAAIARIRPLRVESEEPAGV